MPTTTSTPRWAAWALTALAAAVFTWNAWPTFWTVVDDAYISARYAEQIAVGHGPVYNVDAAPVEGFTNPLFVLLMALLRVVGVGQPFAMVGLGWLFGLLALPIATKLTQHLTQRDDARTGLPALLIAMSPHVAVASTNGLESSQMMALVLAFTWAGLALEGRGLLGGGVLGALLIWTRPEGVVPVVLVTAWRVLFPGPWTTRREVRRGLVVPLLIGAGTLLLGRLLFYGDVVPNTFHAKASFPISETWQVNKQYLEPRLTILVALATQLVAATILAWGHRGRRDVTVTFVVAAALGVIPLSVNLWMPGLRLFLPFLALSAVMAGVALHGLERIPGVPKIAVAAVASLALVGGHAVGHLRTATMARAYDGRHSVLPGNGTELAGRHLAAHAPEGAWLATRDAGCLAYWVGPDVNVAEMHHRSLTLRHPDGKDLDVLETTPRDPAFFASTVRRDQSEGFAYRNDRMVFERFSAPYTYLGRVHQHYHRYYDVYARADLGIPPLPQAAVVNRKGPKPKREVPPGKRATVGRPLPDTGTY